MPRKNASDQPPPKSAVIQIRLDSELATKAAEKARRYGGVSVVLRALLRKWAEQGGIVSTDEILSEVPRAAYGSKKGEK